MLNNEKRLSSDIKDGGQKLKVGSQFRYLGSIINEGCLRISRATQTVEAVAKTKNHLESCRRWPS